MADQIWLVYELEQWEDSSLVGVYTTQDKAEARKVEMEAAAKVVREQEKRYQVWPATLDEAIKSHVEWRRDRHCPKTQDNTHILLGKRCSVCDFELEE